MQEQSPNEIERRMRKVEEWQIALPSRTWSGWRFLLTLTVLFWLILLDLLVASLPTTLFFVWNWGNDIAEVEGIIG